MLAVGVELFIRNDRERFSYVLFVIVYGFFLSYIGYAAVPAVGPRFTLHDFSAISTELPGLFLTEPIRALLNAGESIPKGELSNAIRFVQRDAFPSGHTELTLIALYLASQYRLRSRYVLYLFGSLLFVSTVYLRYHYVIDLLAGAVFMLAAIWTAPKLFAWWENKARK
jgi:membrane-associated phospholipid phosphatase